MSSVSAEKIEPLFKSKSDWKSTTKSRPKLITGYAVARWLLRISKLCDNGRVQWLGDQMHRFKRLACVIAPAWALSSLVYAGSGCADAQAMSTDQIKQAIIQQSIAGYPGHCPCPYDLASNGSKCGKRSAWSKGGGRALICYPDEVTTDMEKQWALQHGYTWNGPKN